MFKLGSTHPILIRPRSLTGNVMTARKKFNVGYPNLYATPGYHKESDDFNRVQRGHGNFLENLTFFTLFALIGGLRNPIAVSVEGVLFSVGCGLYQVGYADTALDVKGARYHKGGWLKHIGLLGVFGSTVGLIGDINKWW